MAVFSLADFDGHEKVVFGNDPESGLKSIIAVHNTNLGPALGGCRMYPYSSEEDAVKDVLRLSRGMTYKSALAGLPMGGGKSVIIGNPATDKSEALFRAMGRFVNSLSGQYVMAQDSGTSVADLQAAAKETSYVAGIEETVDDQGNIRDGNPSPATAFGVFVGIQAAVKHHLGRDSMKGLTVAIQGLGNVGFVLAQHLHGAGAHLLVSDVNEKNLIQARDRLQATVVDNDTICEVEADVFAPCAMGGAINDISINQLRTSIVAGAANNQLATPQMADALRERGILYAPDYVINAGGIIHIHYMRNQLAWEASTQHVLCIGDTLQEIFARADAEDSTTAAIADLMAEERFRPKGVFLASNETLGMGLSVGAPQLISNG